jgi:hypothetical protein
VGAYSVLFEHKAKVIDNSCFLRKKGLYQLFYKLVREDGIFGERLSKLMKDREVKHLLVSTSK